MININTVRIGDVYFSDVAYTDLPHITGRRPVVILDVDVEREYVFYIQLTSQKPEEPPKTIVDKYKLVMIDWEKGWS